MTFLLYDPATRRHAQRFQQPSHFSVMVSFSGSRGTRTHKRGQLATCFQDRALIRPDDFRESRLSLRERASSFEEEGDNQAAGAGVEPASRRSERRVLPIDDPAVCGLETPLTLTGSGRLRGQESNLRTHGSKPWISANRNYPARRGTGGTRTLALVLNRHPLCR